MHEFDLKLVDELVLRCNIPMYGSKAKVLESLGDCLKKLLGRVISVNLRNFEFAGKSFMAIIPESFGKWLATCF